jgi:hypothetical protein
MWGNSPDISKGFFQSGMCEFESSEVSQAFRVSENFLLWMRKARQMPAFLIAKSLWRPMFELLGRKFPKVSSRIQENSRFLETRLGDQRIKPLRARRGSAFFGSMPQPALLPPMTVSLAELFVESDGR